VTSGRYLFDRFVLDPADRTLRRDGTVVEVSARYLDALILLVAEAGALVSKDRFMAQVWHGVPVTDEALTQCIRTLRRQLGDDATQPRFIATVPRHGYRFVAPVTMAADPPAAPARVEPTPPPASNNTWRDAVMLAGAGTLGAGLAGMLGGLFYGSMLSSRLSGAGGVSVLLVLLWLTMVAAVVGGAGVSAGIVAAWVARSRAWGIAGGALGGFAVGGVVKLLGLDAFNLLLGHAPADITGAPEGLGLGAAVGLGAWLAGRTASRRRGIAVAALSGGGGALLILLLGGRMMGGSLDALAQGFPASRLRLDRLGALLGETGFGPATRLATGVLEGALFGGCIVGAMMLAYRALAHRALAGK
jgi:DNA-binding winged helix-turn-helix (wHTH) protein